jgi:hypothetical protein
VQIQILAIVPLSNSLQIYLSLSFTQNSKFSIVHPNTPKPNQGYKLTLMQEGVTKAKTLNMVFNKFLKVPSSPRVKVLNQPHSMATLLLQIIG